VAVLGELPAGAFEGVVFANELLDNLPFDVLEKSAGWCEVLITDDSGPAELLVPAAEDSSTWASLRAPDAAPGARIPSQRAAAEWVRAALDLVRRGAVIAVDYTATTAELATRPFGDWVRTYHAHTAGPGPLHRPGDCDITCDVAIDQLAPDRHSDQAEWLARNGIDALVGEARKAWDPSKVSIDALRARSRVSEAEALTDRAGLGSFTVLEWQPR
jgi:SAM-dependent MidA family methyltransferase